MKVFAHDILGGPLTDRVLAATRSRRHASTFKADYRGIMVLNGLNDAGWPGVHGLFGSSRPQIGPFGKSYRALAAATARANTVLLVSNAPKPAMVNGDAMSLALEN
jgi:hypothetical protein